MEGKRVIIDNGDSIRSVEISKSQWPIFAVREHIVSQEVLACGGVSVGVEEAAQRGVVVAGLQIIEAGFFGLSVAIEAKRRSIKLPKKQL